MSLYTAQDYKYYWLLMMGPGQNFFTQVGSDQFVVAQVGSAIFGLSLVL